MTSSVSDLLSSSPTYALYWDSLPRFPTIKEGASHASLTNPPKPMSVAPRGSFQGPFQDQSFFKASLKNLPAVHSANTVMSEPSPLSTGDNAHVSTHHTPVSAATPVSLAPRGYTSPDQSQSLPSVTSSSTAASTSSEKNNKNALSAPQIPMEKLSLNHPEHPPSNLVISDSLDVEEEEEEDDVCALCDNPVDMEFHPCGCKVMCSECAGEQVKRCPACRVREGERLLYFYE